MLEHEDFYHLNKKESEKIVRKTKLGPRKEHGEDDIPFDVRFLNLVLNRA